MKSLKKIISLITLIFILSAPFSASAIEINATSACVIDYTSGEILYSKNENVVRAPASLTKVMTLFMLYEGLERGDFTKETLIPVSPSVAAASKSREASNIPLDSNSKYRIDELIEAMIAPSACAACTAFAEYVSGSEANFAALMTKRAAELGLNLYFEDASGLSDNNTATAASLAELTRIFISKYPDILTYASKPYVVIRGRRYDNTNFLTNPKSYYYFPEVDGFKTGTTSLAGKCLISTAAKDNSRIISVNMNSRSNDYRFSDATTLLRYGLELVSEKNSSVFATDIKTFIDGNEIECCYFLGTEPALLITAENLKDYGFDVYYDSEASTLHLSENSEKSFTFQAIEKRGVPGEKLFNLYNGTIPTVVLHKGDSSFTLKTVYSLNGFCLIDVDELAQYYYYVWDENERTASIFARGNSYIQSSEVETVAK